VIGILTGMGMMFVVVSVVSRQQASERHRIMWTSEREDSALLCSALENDKGRRRRLG
jgi:hypothetical protein